MPHATDALLLVCPLQDESFLAEEQRLTRIDIEAIKTKHGMPLAPAATVPSNRLSNGENPLPKPENPADFVNFDPACVSNVGPDILTATPGLAVAIAQGAEDRLSQGYAADGSLGGAFSEANPPEGLEFSGYLKGNTGIVWKQGGVGGAGASTEPG